VITELKRTFKVLQIFDVPDKLSNKLILVLAKEKKGKRKFICVPDDGHWLCGPVSKDRWMDIHSGSMDLRAAFWRIEGGQVFSTRGNIWEPVNSAILENVPVGVTISW